MNRHDRQQRQPWTVLTQVTMAAAMVWGLAAEDAVARRRTTPDGVVVETKRMPKSKTVSIRLGVSAGGADQGGVLSGTPHYLEHLLFHGPGRRLVAHVEACGGVYNAYTSGTSTVYIVDISPDCAEKAVVLLVQAVTNPNFDAMDVESERSIVLAEAAERGAQMQVLDAVDMMMFGGANDGTIIGSKWDIARINKRHLRQFYQGYYTPRRMKVVVTGDIDAVKMERLVTENILLFPSRESLTSKRETPEDAPLITLRTGQKWDAVAIHSPRLTMDQCQSLALAVEVALQRRLVIAKPTFSTVSSSCVPLREQLFIVTMAKPPPTTVVETHGDIRKLLQDVRNNGLTNAERRVWSRQDKARRRRVAQGASGQATRMLDGLMRGNAKSTNASAPQGLARASWTQFRTAEISVR